MADTPTPAENFAVQLALLRAQFVAQLGGTLGELEDRATACGARPPREMLEELHQRLHKLAGSGGTFGFPELSRRARALEVRARGWLDLAQAVPPEQWQTWQVDLRALRQTLDAQPSDQPKPVEVAPAVHARTQAHVVLVHDDEKLADTLCRGLSQFGYAVDAYAGFAGAWSALQSDPPDLLLLQSVNVEKDAMLLAPDLTRLFTQLGYQLPLVLLAPEAGFAAQLAAARLGCEVFLPPPVDAPTVAARIESLLREREQPPYRVLIVDDDEILAEHYRLTLNGAGMLAERCSQPADVPKLLQSLRPDVVLMDLQMPGYSGAELARAMRYDPAWQGLPIVFLSAETDLGEQNKAMSSGADEFLVKPIPDAQLVAAARARAQRARKLAELMSQDSLTGLLKHANIKDRLAQEVERSARQDKPVAVVMVDIDFFKKVNDTWGHPVGDQVIKSLGHLLRQRLRRQDSVGRYGGEEFLAILPDCSSADAARVVDDIRQRFAAIVFSSQGESFSVTLSAGIASSEQQHNATDLLAAADAALYQAKRGGRNQVRLDAATEGDRT